MTQTLRFATLLTMISLGCKNTGGGDPAPKKTEPSAPAAPAPTAAVMRVTADQWLALHYGDTLKGGEVVAVTFHTSKDTDVPCSETNTGKWACTVLINGKRDGADDQDSIDEQLDKTQTTVYTTKIKPDRDVTLTCKVRIDNGYPRLTACQ